MTIRIVEEIVVEDQVDDHMVVVMMIKRTRMRLEVAVRTRGETISIVTMIRTIDIREEEVEDKDLEDEASVGNVFTAENKSIENSNVPSTKEG